MTETRNVSLKIIATSDVHGCFFSHDFIGKKTMAGSLSKVMTLVRKERRRYGRNMILLDGGDILQGQPSCYYSNFVYTKGKNVAAKVTNYMGYDAQLIGNHDIETGHDVYDKWRKDNLCPVLCANAYTAEKPYFEPYAVMVRDGIKIAIIGLITPAIPHWLGHESWSGMEFGNITDAAELWIKRVKKEEHPDITILMMHSGAEGGITTDTYAENAALEVARKIDGIDLILFGHDHAQYEGVVHNKSGNKVTCLNPSANAQLVSETTINLTVEDYGNSSLRITDKIVSGHLTDITSLVVDDEMEKYFNDDISNTQQYVNRTIGYMERSIFTRDCFFGSAPLTDFIHDIQLKITGAEISFNAPLSFDTCIIKGEIHVSDLFELYKYENQIYTLNMTGEEIRRYLEMSYDKWIVTMHSPTDNIMQLDNSGKSFRNLAFDFDSAAGIDYVVDVTKTFGNRIKIIRMSDGMPFCPSSTYRTAMNSYRGNGGGELLTKGAGISHEELKRRKIFESKKDQRYYIMQEIENSNTVCPQAHNNWNFIPKKWAAQAIERDRKLIFGE